MTTAARLAGVGGYVPPRIVTNHELSRHLDTSDEWIRTRTGIRQRHVVDRGITTSDLAIIAARKALDTAPADPEVDLLVLATTTPDQPCPATAPAIAAALGLGTIPAYDIAAVCSGFIYALAAATNAVRAGQSQRALVIGAETFTTILDPTDRTTTPIFGDAAGAVLVEACAPGAAGELHEFSLGSDGTQVDLIGISGGGAKERTNADASATFDRHFRMQGQQVFRSAVSRMTESSQTVLARTGWNTAELDWLVGHQANARIIAAIGDHLGVDADKAIVNLDKVGNTSAASIPLALADAASRHRIKTGHKLLLTAFGGGTTWGAVTLTWPQLPAVLPITDDHSVAHKQSA
ncbi:beta-ketoacyl-ACP synthase III [Nocardia sp. NPDC050175]|uniref:beta-ketoacyl-ACP synthase III n=1 Tax=Nocardia sp. NPDC050175 TaxID=3364317 RepID=UPI0037A4E259